MAVTEGLVILDEIQDVPRTFSALKAKIDTLRRKKQGVKFLLTGSADIMLLPHLAEALVGRLYVRTLYPFSTAEVLKTSGRFVRTLFKAPPNPGAVFSKPDLERVVSRAGFPRPSLGVKTGLPGFKTTFQP